MKLAPLVCALISDITRRRDIKHTLFGLKLSVRGTFTPWYRSLWRSAGTGGLKVGKAPGEAGWIVSACGPMGITPRKNGASEDAASSKNPRAFDEIRSVE